MNLSDQMRNVLEAIVDQTVKSRGPHAGAIKKRAYFGDTYNRRTLLALESRGLIAWGDGVHGEGYAATVEGFNLCREKSL